MKTLDNLEVGDYIAFGFDYNGGKPNEIIVDNISSIIKKDVIVHFLYGYKSLSEVIKKKNILAIGETRVGKGSIKGWEGDYHILDQEKIDEIKKRER